MNARALAVLATLAAAPLFVGSGGAARADVDWSVMPSEVCASQNNGCGQYAEYALKGVIPEIKNKDMDHATMSIWFDSHPQYRTRLKRLYDLAN